MKKQQNILLAFYGDDFTGSTDALEFISQAGAKTVLFIKPPSAEELKNYPSLDVIGVAGATRSMAPGEMEKELQPAFEQLKSTGAKHIHYKVCSTFDSSPTIGSIGMAMDTGAGIFKNKFIPVLGGTPALGRYCLFGNLFAQMGIGSNGAIYRLDRHPSMRNHPVTPADEADLVLHLQKQTKRKGTLIDIIQQAKPVAEWNDVIKQANEFVLLDALYEEQLLKTGEWLEEQADQQSPLFSIGSSAVEMALGDCWNKKGLLTPVKQWTDPGTADPLLVVSGSCSPVTAAQISWAKENGFSIVELDATAVANNDSNEHILIKEVIGFLKEKKQVIVHTGPKQSANLSSQKLGSALGNIAKAAAEAGYIKRVIISGGDTSSYAARAMGIDAVEMIAPLINGAPLCKAFSTNNAIHGLQVNFKGGQVGPEDYFGICIKGKR